MTADAIGFRWPWYEVNYYAVQRSHNHSHKTAAVLCCTTVPASQPRLQLDLDDGSDPVKANLLRRNTVIITCWSGGVVGRQGEF